MSDEPNAPLNPEIIVQLSIGTLLRVIPVDDGTCYYGVLLGVGHGGQRIAVLDPRNGNDYENDFICSTKFDAFIDSGVTYSINRAKEPYGELI